jgi:methionyl-tRNA formyltransferase
MGTPEFALPTLERLVEHYDVVGVVTQPDRRSGRGRRITMPPVKEMAVAEGIPVFQPKRMRDAEAVAQIRAWSPDVAVVAAYGQILPASVLEIPPFGFLNVHASLLPRWRGASPIEGALRAGDAVTGVTIMKLDEGLDTGPVLAMRETPIAPQETAADLEARLAEMGAALLMDVLPDYLSGALAPEPQPEEGVTITRRIKTAEAQLDWSMPATVLHNQVRAFNPTPGAYTFWDGVRLKVLRTELVDDAPDASDLAPGTVFLWKDMPTVMTGQGCLTLVYLQLAGKRPMDGGAFVRGRQDFVGAKLGPQGPGE